MLNPGGASGFGLTMATRLAESGMKIAILDVSAEELKKAEAALQTICPPSHVLAVTCNVTKYEQCSAAQQAVANFFSRPVSFLFNNAGIAGACSKRHGLTD